MSDYADDILCDFIERSAHDLRTPLTTVRGYAEGLLTVAASPEKRERYIRIINAAAIDMDNIIEELELYGLLMAGRLEVSKEMMPLNGLFSDIRGALGRSMDKTSARPELSVADTASGTADIYADSYLICTVTGLVIRYMLQFVPDTDGRIAIGLNADNDYVYLSICDNGPVPDAGELAAIFDEHKRTGQGRIQKKNGSGLGLSIVKDIVMIYGGNITADSCGDRGMRINIALKTMVGD